MPKPLSEIRDANRDINYRVIERVLNYFKNGATYSNSIEIIQNGERSAESRLLQAVVEKIDSLKDGFMCLKCEHWNDALSDLKAYIEEGLK